MPTIPVLTTGQLRKNGNGTWRKEFYKSRGYEIARKGIKKPIRSEKYDRKDDRNHPADHHEFRTIHPEKMESLRRPKRNGGTSKSDLWSIIVIGLVK